MEYYVRNTFIQKSIRKYSQRLVPDLFLLFKKALYEVKASGWHLSFNIFWYTSLKYIVKTNFITFQTVNPEVCSILISYKRVWV